MGLLVVGAVLIVGAAALLFFAKKAQETQEKLLVTQTSTCADLAQVLDAVSAELGGVSGGQVTEIKGRTVGGTPVLKAPLSDRDCVWYRSTITEHYREYEWRGQEPNRRRELVDKSRGVSDECSTYDIVIDDGTGRITVDLEGCDVDGAEQIMDRRVSDDDGWAHRFEIKVGVFSFGNSEGITGYQHQEWIIPVGEEVYAIGEARKDGNGLRLAKAREKGVPFMVSTRGEEEVMASKGKQALWMRIGAGACVVAGTGLLIAGLLA